MSDVASVRMIVLDVDGVLTDGGIIYDAEGRESKRFNVKDGAAMKNAARVTGLKVGVITARRSPMVEKRMKELDIALFVQGSKNKAADVTRLAEHAGVALADVAFVGDDLVDLPAFSVVGYPIAVADAAPELLEQAAYVTKVTGGQGAARDAIEHVLRAQGKWADVVASFMG